MVAPLYFTLWQRGVQIEGAVLACLQPIEKGNFSAPTGIRTHGFESLRQPSNRLSYCGLWCSNSVSLIHYIARIILWFYISRVESQIRWIWGPDVNNYKVGGGGSGTHRL